MTGRIEKKLIEMKKVLNLETPPNIEPTYISICNI